MTDLVDDDGRQLTGKVALVTGAGRGQGRAIALRLARAGVRVIAGDVADGGVVGGVSAPLRAGYGLRLVCATIAAGSSYGGF